ncbi:inositol polyphosphate 5-phosphatase [Borealophlyctis nickersoniae]|nr:inositol polyphosphate 5-phosphatase [Borealophlyctis nickersoniae]
MGLRGFLVNAVLYRRHNERTYPEPLPEPTSAPDLGSTDNNRPQSTQETSQAKPNRKGRGRSVWGRLKRFFGLDRRKSKHGSVHPEPVSLGVAELETGPLQGDSGVVETGEMLVAAVTPTNLPSVPLEENPRPYCIDLPPVRVPPLWSSSSSGSNLNLSSSESLGKRKRLSECLKDDGAERDERDTPAPADSFEIHPLPPVLSAKPTWLNSQPLPPVGTPMEQPVSSLPDTVHASPAAPSIAITPLETPADASSSAFGRKHPSVSNLRESRSHLSLLHDSRSHRETPGGTLRATLSKSLSDVKRLLRETFGKSKEDIHLQVAEKQNVRVYIVTWNMNGRPLTSVVQKLPTADLSSFLSDLAHPERTPPFDGCHFIAIGTQECLTSIQKSMAFPSKVEWEKLLLEHLGDKYDLIGTETLVGTHLAVFVWKPYRLSVKRVDSHRVATGIGQVLGNKGGIGIAAKFEDTSILFVNSHLTAGHDKVAERNNDYKRINEELKLPGFHARDAKYRETVDRFDFVFWFGDLNYRINGTRPIVDALLAGGRIEVTIITFPLSHLPSNIRSNTINTRHPQVLLNNDQLSIERSKDAAFTGFEEHPITFRPTYKFDVISSTLLSSSLASSPTSFSPPSLLSTSSPATPYPPSSPLSLTVIQTEETSLPAVADPALDATVASTVSVVSSGYDTSIKMRIPAWTDRILYRCRKARVWVDGKEGPVQPPPLLEGQTGEPLQIRTTAEPLSVEEPEGSPSPTAVENKSDNARRLKSRGSKKRGTSGSASTPIPPTPPELDNGRVQVEKYVSCPDVTCSDHRPVVGVFKLDVLVPPPNVETEEGMEDTIPRATRERMKWWW